MADTIPARSKNESIKESSRYLRGTIAEGLTRGETGALSEDDTQLTKFHGTYQQDDRDLRPERRRKKLEKAFSFMIRARIPAGVVTAAQWLRLDQLADDYAGGTIRLTTRETVQFHHIIKANLRRAMQAINAAGLDSLAACGDVNRNVIAASNPYRSPAHAAALDLAHDLSAHLLPRTGAYHEIWLDDGKLTDNPDGLIEILPDDGVRVRVAEAPEDSEPIYGRHYLPRKFKIAIAVPPSNDIDVFAHDLGFIAIVEDGAVVGYTVTVGGGMGMTHGELDTFPRTADLLGYCRADQAIDIAEKVVTTQRDHGNRALRKRARLKYTIEDHGIDWFRAEVERRLGYALEAPKPFAFEGNGDPYGWFQDREGNWHVTLFLENGRVCDTDQRPIKTGLREIAGIHDGEFCLTANQNLTIARIAPEKKAGIETLLKAHGLIDWERTGLRLNSMACVALPTCGLALAESERALPDLVTALEAVVERAGLRNDAIVIRMTGCPNGCARPYLAEIGLVGGNPGLYNLYLGAAFDGSRLNKLYRKDVTPDQIVEALTPVIEDYARERRPGEHFGDFTIRRGLVKPTLAGNRFHEE